MKFPKPWFRADRGVWYVTLDGKQHNLGADREAAFDLYRELLKAPRQKKVDLKSVAVVLDNFHDLVDAGLSVFKYIETFYNPVRLHQTLGYNKSPNQHEADHAPAAAA